MRFGSERGQAFRATWLAGASVAMIVSATPAAAQGTGSAADDAQSGEVDRQAAEIVVTAQKRAESLIEVPQAISVIDGETVEKLGVTSIDELTGLSPNFNFDANSARDERITIRGVSSDTRFLGSESAVGVVVDGVFQSGVSALNLDVAEIERVEVLRGPQGVLFGRNTTAGLINVTTRRPSDEFRGRFIGEYGNYDHLKLILSASGPVVENKLFAGFSILHERRDGFLKTGEGDDAWNQDLVAGRGDIVWRPNEVWDIRLLADYSWEDHSFGQIDFSPENRIIEHAFIPNRLKREVFSTSLNVARSFDDGGEFRTIGAYKNFDIIETIDADSQAVPFELLTNTTLETGKEASIEMQYASPSGESIEWLVGLYGQNVSNTVNGLYRGDWDRAFEVLGLRAAFGLPPGTTLRNFTDLTGQSSNCSSPAPACLDRALANVLWDFDTTTIAAFTNIKFNFTDRFNAQIGGRVSYERKKFDYASTGTFYGIPGVISPISAPFFVDDRISDFQFTPRLALSFQASGMANFYASAAKGYKSGNFYGNVLGTSDVDGNGQNDFLERLRVEPETSWTFEAGVKGANDWLRYDLTGYYIVYNGLQTQALLENQIPGFAPFNYLDNADFENYGIEAEVNAKLGRAFSLSLGGAYNHGEFTDYPNCAAFAGTIITCTGNRPVYAPKFTGFGRLDWSVPLSGNGWKIIGYGQARYRDSRFFTVTNDVSDGDYWLVDALLGVESPDGRFQISAWGRNLTDVDYFTLRVPAGSAIASQIGEPRTYGLRLTTRF